MLGDQLRDGVYILPDRQRTDLLMITDDHDFFAQENRDQAEHVHLAGLVDDDYIERRTCRIEAVNYATERHDPHWNRARRRPHPPLRLGSQHAGALAGAFSDPLDCIEPAD